MSRSIKLGALIGMGIGVVIVLGILMSLWFGPKDSSGSPGMVAGAWMIVLGLPTGVLTYPLVRWADPNVLIVVSLVVNWGIIGALGGAAVDAWNRRPSSARHT